MSQKETSSWITIGALGLAAWWYFASVFARSTGLEALPSPSVPELIKYTVLLVAVLVVLEIINASLRPKTANQPADEREVLIATQASHLAGMVGSFFVVASLVTYLIHPASSGDLLFYCVLGSVVVSQFVESALVIFYSKSGI